MNAIQHFTLRGIYLRESQVSMREGFMPHVRKDLPGTFRITQQEIIKGEDINQAGDKTPFCTIITCFEFGYLENQLDDPSQITAQDFIASITAKIAADYIIQDAEQLTDEALQQWAGINTLLHTWPYWREYCQTTQMRMNLPAHLMPLFGPPS